MLDSQILDDSNIVAVSCSGAVGADERATLRRQIGTVITAQGSARLLVEVGDREAGRVEVTAVWEDLTSAALLDDVSHIALVGDDAQAAGVTAATGRLASTQTRTFAANDRDRAILWLQED